MGKGGICGGGNTDASDGIVENRRCTDVLFCIIFMAFWAGMVGIGAIAFSEGDPNLLYYGFDSQGNLCGTSNKAKDNVTAANTTTPLKGSFSSRKYLHFLDVTEYSTMTILPPKSVCMNSCPTKTIVNGFSKESTVCEYYGVGYSGSLSGVETYDVQYYDRLGVAAKLSSMAFSGPCYPVFTPYAPLMNRCVPSPDASALAAMGSSDSFSKTTKDGSAYSIGDLTTALSAVSSSRNLLQDYLEDCLKAWVVIVVCGFIGGLLFSIVWMTFLRYFAGCMAWVTVLAVNLICIILTVYCAMKGGLIGADSVGTTFESSTLGTNITINTTGIPESVTVGGVDVDLGASEDADVFKTITYIGAAVTALVFLFTLLMIRRIMVAVACLKVASEAIAAMPRILFMPLLPAFMNICFMVWATLVAVMLYASGEIVTKNGQTKIEWDSDLQKMTLYHIFGVFWTTQFIAGFGMTVTAGAIGYFYWSRKKMPDAPITASIKRATYYHLGSIALGSFIVAVVQFIRFVLEYIDRKTKKMQDSNPIMKYAMCCVKYCMWYLEKILKFINRNAYILVAIKGYSYCYSAITAVKLIIVNALRIAAVNTVGDFLIWLGKLVVAGICGFLAFLMTDTAMYTDPDSATYLTSPILPIILTTFIAYLEADVFLAVYEMAVDTILLSFCEDCGSSGGPKYAPPLLMEAIGESSNKVETA